MSSFGNTSKMENVIISCYYRVDIHPILCLWLSNSTKHSRVKSRTYTDHGSDETQTQNNFILTGKHNSLGHKTCLAKTVSFASKNQGFPSLGVIITTGKISSVKDLWKSEIHKLF